MCRTEEQLPLPLSEGDGDPLVLSDSRQLDAPIVKPLCRVCQIHERVSYRSAPGTGEQTAIIDEFDFFVVVRVRPEPLPRALVKLLRERFHNNQRCRHIQWAEKRTSVLD